MKLFSLFISNPSRTVKIRVKFRLEATRKLKIKKGKKYPVFGSILKEIGENKMKRNVKGTMEGKKKVLKTISVAIASINKEKAILLCESCSRP